METGTPQSQNGNRKSPMTNDSFPDDSWDELTRELGVEKSPQPVRDPAPIHNPPDPTIADDEPVGDDSEFDGDLGDEAEGEALDGAEAPPGDDQPGSGRKRRRRRRRRKKGPGEGEAEPAAIVEPEEAAAPHASHSEAEFSESEFDSHPYDDEPVGMPLAAEEDTAGEVLRDLIANWNVPSWDAIISGLNRP